MAIIPCNQLSLADVFQIARKFMNLTNLLFCLFLNYTFISMKLFLFPPESISMYQRIDPLKYPLHSLLWALIIQRIFSITTDQLLFTFLTYSKPLREFCGFPKIPDASKITRFKQDFLIALQLIFDNLVDLTVPICRAIDSAKSDMTIIDSSGIKTFIA